VLTVTFDLETLNFEFFFVVLVQQSYVSITRLLYVMSVDDAAKIVKIKYPGANSEDYFVQVTSKSTVTSTKNN